MSSQSCTSSPSPSSFIIKSLQVLFTTACCMLHVALCVLRRPLRNLTGISMVLKLLSAMPSAKSSPSLGAAVQDAVDGLTDKMHRPSCRIKEAPKPVQAPTPMTGRPTTQDSCSTVACRSFCLLKVRETSQRHIRRRGIRIDRLRAAEDRVGHSSIVEEELFGSKCVSVVSSS